MQTCDSLNIHDVCINTNKTNKGSHGVFIPLMNLRSKEPILIQTPKMYAPFGAGCYKKSEVIAAGKIPRYDVQLSLDASTHKIEKLGHFLMDLDAKVLRAISQDESILQLLNVKKINKKTGKPKTLEEIQDDLENNKYTPIVRIKPESKYPPLFKIAIARDSKTQCIDTFCNIGDKSIALTDDNIDEIFHKNMICKCVFWISHIWVLSNRFGVSLKLKRCKLFPRGPNTYGFLPSSDDENEQPSSTQKQSQSVMNESNDTNNDTENTNDINDIDNINNINDSNDDHSDNSNPNDQ